MLSRKIITLLTYLIIVAIIFAIQPYIMFDKDGNMKPFGYAINDKTTILPLILFLPFLAIILYLIVLALEMIYT